MLFEPSWLATWIAQVLTIYLFFKISFNCVWEFILFMDNKFGYDNPELIILLIKLSPVFTVFMTMLLFYLTYHTPLLSAFYFK